MKRLSILILAVSVTAFACKKASSSNNNNGGPTGPTENTTTTTTTFTTALKPGNEIPPVTGGEGNVSGQATIAIKATRNASNVITSATADFQVSLSGFPGGSSVTMAHIHAGNNTVGAGGIVLNTGITSSDVTMSSGNASFTRNGVNVASDLAQNMINNPANFYFNVHSNANPNGVARGQADGSGAPVDPNNPQIPDPENPYPYLSKPHH